MGGHERPGVPLDGSRVCLSTPQEHVVDSHDEGCHAYGPDVSLLDSTLAVQELRS